MFIKKCVIDVSCTCHWCSSRNVSLIYVTLMVANKSAIALSKNLMFHNRSKHIKTKFHFLKTCLEEKKMELDFISSKNQLANLFTKVGHI